MYKKSQHIHFVGIGGIGMSGIAELLLNLGYRVSGSDLRESVNTKRLSGLGATVYYGHDKSNIRDVDVVVVSSAVREENPEIQQAHEAGIPVIPRAEMLAELMRLKYSVAVAGAHGKTTTTSLIASVLEQGELDPTVVIGGRLNKTNTNAFLGSGDFLIAEADESDGSFLNLPPTIAVVTNIDREHMDHYGNFDSIKESFLEFLNKVPFYGLCIICLDDENLQALIPRLSKRVLTYGCASQADLQARNIHLDGFATNFEVFFHEKRLGKIRLNLPGIHNAYNALAAICVGLELDLDFMVIKKALRNFKGIQRRFQVRGRQADVVWIDDYAHHPTEIKMTLKAARELGAQRLVVLFQPHRYTRTRDLFNDFMTAFYDADVLVVTDIYAAGEQPLAEVTAQRFCDGLKEYGNKDITLVPELDAAVEHLAGILQAGDLLLTLGAGTVWTAGESTMKSLKAKR